MEDYEYFTVYFFKAHIPLLIILVRTALGIVIVCFLRVVLPQGPGLCGLWPGASRFRRRESPAGADKF